MRAEPSPHVDTRIEVHIAAPRAAVYRALVDAEAVATWMVPDDMSSHVHAFDPREGGAIRISLTYAASTGIGKTSGATDTFQGRFVALVPDRRVVWEVAFESADPGMRRRVPPRSSAARSAQEAWAVDDDLTVGGAVAARCRRGRGRCVGGDHHRSRCGARRDDRR